MTNLETKKREYHEVKIPLIDIYQDGEEEAFSVLERRLEGEKNLIIFPSEFRHSLVPDRTRSGQRFRSVPGTYALEHLAQLPTVSSNENYTLFEASPGLDIAYIREPNFLNKSNLNQRVVDLFGRTPVIVTTSEDELLNYNADGIKAEKPRDFILAEAEIVNRGRIQGTNKLCARLYESETKSVPIEEARELMKKSPDSDPPNLYFNQFIEFTGNNNTIFAIVRPDGDNPIVELIRIPKNFNYHIGDHHFSSTVGITPKWLEQYIAVQHALINPKINLVLLGGSFGSAKTILTYSSGLEQVLIYPDEIQRKRGLPFGKERKGAYRQIAIFRPNDPIGGKKRALSPVPGGIWDKTEHQFGSFLSAHETLEHAGVSFPFEDLLKHPLRKNKVGPRRSPNLQIGEASLPPDCEAVKIYSFADIQGCNFEDLYVIIDEAQNFTQEEMKALFSRACDSSKYIVLGDPHQVVNTECSKDRNGMTSAIRHYMSFEDVILFNLTINNRGPISRRAESWRS